MATSKTLAPTNVTISIPAMADAPDASVFSNCVDKEADAINALNSQKGSKNTISSDTEILGYAPGAYMIALSAASEYLPERWGTLIIDKSGTTYGVATFIATNGTIYTRHMNGSSWHGDWARQTVVSTVKSVTTGADGTVIISDYGFDKVVSITMESVNNYFCAIRKSQSGNILLFVYGTSFTPVANETLSVRIWYR